MQSGIERAADILVGPLSRESGNGKRNLTGVTASAEAVEKNGFVLVMPGYP